MIASLPMYARGSNRAAHDTLWALIRDGLRDRGTAAPDGLDHDTDHMVGWGRQDLVLGQICNLPYRQHFRDRVTIIGAADYGLDGCARGYYRSHIVMRADDPLVGVADVAGRRFVCNDIGSQSGYGAPQAWAQSQGSLLAVAAQTGSHRASIDAVAEGLADIASIDAQTWRIEAQENPNTAKLKIIGHTAATPGLSFVTHMGADTTPYFAAISDAIAALPQDAAAILGLKGIVALGQGAYDLPLPPEPAEIGG